jgi:hypothetical protein
MIDPHAMQNAPIRSGVDFFLYIPQMKSAGSPLSTTCSMTKAKKKKTAQVEFHLSTFVST